MNINLLGALGLIFVTLKLTGCISWSWWWVTIPFWIGPAVVLGAALLFAVFAAVVTFLFFICEIIKHASKG